MNSKLLYTLPIFLLFIDRYCLKYLKINTKLINSITYLKSEEIQCVIIELHVRIYWFCTNTAIIIVNMFEIAAI